MPIYKMNGRKDGLQKYRVRINYTNSGGQAKQLDRIAYGMQAAKELEADLLKELKLSGMPERLNIDQLVTEHLELKQTEVRESTLNGLIKLYNTYILPFFGDMKLDRLNGKNIIEWKKWVADKGLSVKTNQNAYGALRGLLNYAVKMDYISKSPLDKVDNFRDAYESKKEMDFYTPDEFLKFIAAAKAQAETENQSINEWHFYTFFNIAYFTGARKGEINALKWSDIDGNIMHIRRSINQKLKGADRETPPKNRSSIRDIQIPDPLLKILREHQERCQKIHGYSDEWRICGGSECLRDTTIQHKNEKYSKLAGIKTIRIHDFRHSHASLLANEGINIQEIARRLGHADIKMTWNVYAHLYPREEERAVNILNRIHD